MKYLISLVFIILMLLSTSSAQANADFRKRLSANLYDISSVDDIAAEISFGREIAARLLRQLQLSDNIEAQKYVNLVGSALVTYSGRQDIIFYFGVLKSDEPNAFAVPGGYIFITEGLLKEIKNEDELAFVIAHEITHICARHIIRELDIKASDSGEFSGLSRLIGATFDPLKVTFEKLVDEATNILLKRGYRINDELEADSEGLILMAMTGYNPNAALSLLESIKKFEPMENKQDSEHPLYKQRMEIVQKIISDNGLNDNKKIITERYKSYVKFH